MNEHDQDGARPATPHRFLFVGVTTSQSSIMRIFPRWRHALGLPPDVELAGRDLPLRADPERYREVVREIRDDPAILGALVTAHKMDLYAAAHDLFGWVDEYGRLLGEVSCIVRREGALLGWAKDTISSGRALDAMLGSGYFGRTGGEVLCFGAGGAGNAILLHLLTRPNDDDRPGSIVLVDRDPGRLGHARALHRALGSNVSIEYVQHDDPARNDELVARLAAGSLVVNATGMGKDLPGSPVSDGVRFPRNGIAWELNYRYRAFGDGPYFLQQAAAQRESRNLRLEDGWRLFILGWTSVMEEVFERPIAEEDLEVLSREAAFARPVIPAMGRVS